MKKQNRSVILTVAVVILLLLGAVYSVFFYHKYAFDRARQDSSKFLSDSATVQANTFRLILEGQYDVLRMIAQAPEFRDSQMNSTSAAILNHLSNTSNFNRIVVVDAQGITYDHEGNRLDISQRSYFQECMRGSKVIENILNDPLDPKADFILAVPVIRDNLLLGAIIGTYDFSNFTAKMGALDYSTDEYAFVCDTRGNLLITSEHAAYLHGTVNLLHFLQNTQPDFQQELQKLQQTLQDERSGLLEYALDGQNYYCAYQPLGINGWVLFNVVPAAIVRERLDVITRMDYLHIFTVAIIALLMGGIIVLLSIRVHKQSQKEHEAISIANERFRIAIKNTSITIWDYDFRTRQIIQTEQSMAQHGFEAIVENVPESLIESGFVHPDSVQAFKAMYKQLADGATSAEGVFLMQTADRKNWWYEHIQYSNLLDSNGKPYRAIGISQDVTDKQELFKAAHTDSLTGLLNHSATMQKIEQLLNHTDSKGFSALFFIDLDNFKDINDTFGHKVGDETLTKAADIIKNIFRPDDIIGRIGGDEYLVFISGIPNLQVLHKKANDLVQALQLHYAYGVNGSINLSASIGLAIHHLGETLDELYKRADAALYRAKELGRNTYYLSEGNALELHCRTAETLENIPGNLKPIHLQTLLDNMAGGVILVEVAATFNALYISPSFYKMTGLHPKQIQPYAHNLLDMIHPDDRAEFEQRLRQGAQSYLPTGMSYRITDCEGKPAWRNIRAVRIPDEESANPVMIAVITDITTERKTDALLHAIAEHSPVGIGVFSVEQAIKTVFINDFFLQMLECTREEYSAAVGNDAMGRIIPEDRAAVKAALQKVLQENIPQEVVYRNQRILRNHHQYLKANIAQIPGVSAEPLIVVIFTDVTRQKVFDQSLSATYREGLLEYENKRMQFLFEKSSVEAFEVNIVERTMHCSQALITKFAFPSRDFDNMPDSILNIEAMHPDSFEAHRKFYEQIFTGRPEGSCIIKIRLSDANYSLQKLAYTTIYSADGLPLRAIGFCETVQGEGLLKFTFDQEDNLYELMQSNFVLAARINISKNQIERLVPDKKPASLPDDRNYETYLTTYCRQSVDKKDYAQLLKNLLPQAVAKRYENGQKWLYWEMRLIDDAGKIFWVSFHAGLHISPYNGDLYMFAYVRNIDTVKRFELSMNQKPQRNALTGLYAMPTIKALIETYLEAHPKNQSHCGLMLIRIKNYAEMAENLGTDGFNALIITIVRKLSLFIGETCVLGQLNEDRFLVFCPEALSEKDFYTYAQKLMFVLNSPNFLTVPQEQNFIYTVGAVCHTYENVNFDCLYEAALRAKRRATSLNPIQMGYSESSSENIAKLSFKAPQHISDDKIFEQTIRESTIFRKCTQLIATSTVPGSALNTVLELLGRYFEADRAYLLNIHDGLILSNTYEWCETGITPEIDNLQNLPLTDFPSFYRSYQTKDMFLMHNIAQSAGSETERGVLEAQGIYSLYIAPLMNNNTVFGFIGVDNPRREEDSVHVLDTISQIVAGELIKTALLQKEKELRQLDLVSGAKSRVSFNEFISELKPESLSSMGAFMANVMNLAALNIKYGMNVGDQALHATAKILQQAFGLECVYRYGDSIIMALPQDLDSKTFYAQALQVAAEFEKTVSYNVAVGYTWSDTLHEANTVLSSVNILMNADKNDKLQCGNKYTEARRTKVHADLQESLHSGKALIYLQPKVNIHSGTLCGAEALIRMQDGNGKIIPPAAFIPLLEDLNLIRHIDFFVLDRTAEFLSHRQKQGLQLFPVSLNFSRSTFLEPYAVEHICTVCDKYEISKAFLEVEITESLGDLETESIALVAKKYAEAGIRLALDDFGAKYSNISIFGNIPFTTLKMDKSMVDDIGLNPKMLDIAEAIIKLCHKHDIHVVAEGVEQKEQLHLLRSIKCDIVQGYFINKPLPIADFERIYNL